MLYNENWTEPTTWQEVLLLAADLIEKDGWCRGVFQRGNRHCMTGGIVAVCDHSLELTEKAVANLSVHLGMPITEYNDYKAKSGKEVVAEMRAVANK